MVFFSANIFFGNDLPFKVDSINTVEAHKVNATLNDYWQAKAEWTLIQINTDWSRGYSAGALIKSVGNSWYLFTKKINWGDKRPYCNYINETLDDLYNLLKVSKSSHFELHLGHLVKRGVNLEQCLDALKSAKLNGVVLYSQKEMYDFLRTFDSYRFYSFLIS